MKSVRGVVEYYPFPVTEKLISSIRKSLQLLKAEGILNTLKIHLFSEFRNTGSN